LVGFDKSTGSYGRHYVDEFLVEIDGHSTDVETEIGRLEGPAAAAARRLSSRARPLPAGLYAVMPSGPDVQASGPALRDGGVFGDMRIFVGEHTVSGPSPADRAALSKYAGLMYQRAPKTENAILRWGEAMDAAARAEIKRLLPRVEPELLTSLQHRRARLATLARQIGERLEAASWWIVRAAAGEEFVLGDSPVAATLALGHDDEGWRAIFAHDSYAVAMPLGPDVALLLAPQKLMPVSGIDATGVGQAINRLIWRAADRFVLGKSRPHVENALPDADDKERRSTVRVEHDVAAIKRDAEAMARRLVADVSVQMAVIRPLDAMWRRWTGCRLEFGYAVFAAEDRDFFVGPDPDGPGLPPPCPPFPSTAGIPRSRT
jgi:hypothetical protein